MRIFLLYILVIVHGMVDAQIVNPVILTPEEAVSLALENNIVLQKDGLETRKYEFERTSALDFDPLEVNVRGGQLYDNHNGQYLEINQDFGSLPELFLKYRLANEKLHLKNSESLIREKEITVEVKSAYYFWIYLNSKLSVLEEEDRIFSGLKDSAGLQGQKEEVDALQVMRVETAAADVKSRMEMLQDELEISRNKLKQIIVTNEEIVPALTGLSMYQVVKKDTGFYSSSIIADYYHAASRVSLAMVKSRSAAFFPGISVGVTHQNLGTLSNLWAWQVGFQFPILFFSRTASLRQARLEAEMATKEYEYQLFDTQKTIENLLLDLNRVFKRLLYFDQHALIQASAMEETTSLQLQKKEIGYDEYAEQLESCVSIRLEYLETLNQYNQIAIRLEFYAN